MGQPYKNNDIRTAIKQILNLEQYTDRVPAEISSTVGLVVDVNPNHNRIVNIVRSGTAINATSGTIYTTPTDKDFYILGANLSVIKDVTSTATQSYIQITVDGDATPRSIMLSAGLTLTVQTSQNNFTLPVPIKLTRGTTVTVNNDTAVANISTVGTIYGFTVDTLTYDMGILAQQQAGLK